MPHVPQTIRLLSGHEIPRLALGVYETPVSLAPFLTAHALTHGYRHIDTATGYKNESGVVNGILSSGIPRSQVFYTTKLPPRLRGYEKTKESIKSILHENPGLEGYIDLYLIHAPFGTREDRAGQWRAMVEAQNKGMIRSLGVSNYGVHHLEELREIQAEEKAAGRDPGILSVNQIELHPWMRKRDIVSWCEREGVVLEAYSPLLRGKQWGHPELKRLAEKYGKTEAQVLVRWSLEMGWVTLPKSVKNERIEENGAVWDWEMDQEDVEKLGEEDEEFNASGWDPTKEPLVPKA